MIDRVWEGDFMAQDEVLWDPMGREVGQGNLLAALISRKV
jgi:hypothetical protein